ncbi:MAG: hypothetical protein O3B41_10675 [Bacteroidetes bacterium]|nr:hypothetical protein [Bacteroidota bacterium]
MILVFSIYPIRYANAFCCLGVVAGGLQGAFLVGRNEEIKLETTYAIRFGAFIGFLAAAIMFGFNLVIGYWWSGGFIFDPVPQFLYTFFLALIEGVIGIAGNAPELTVDGGPGALGRFLFQIPSNVLFGGIGGAIASSLYKRQTTLFKEA